MSIKFRVLGGGYFGFGGGGGSADFFFMGAGIFLNGSRASQDIQDPPSDLVAIPVAETFPGSCHEILVSPFSHRLKRED